MPSIPIIPTYHLLCVVFHIVWHMYGCHNYGYTQKLSLLFFVHYKYDEDKGFKIKRSRCIRMMAIIFFCCCTFRLIFIYQLCVIQYWIILAYLNVKLTKLNVCITLAGLCEEKFTTYSIRIRLWTCGSPSKVFCFWTIWKTFSNRGLGGNYFSTNFLCSCEPCYKI